MRAADVVVGGRRVGEPDDGPDPALRLGRDLDEFDSERAGERHGLQQTGRHLARVDGHARTLLAGNFPGKTGLAAGHDQRQPTSIRSPRSSKKCSASIRTATASG